MKAERWEQIKRLCAAALELDAARREKFLEETCAGDPLLRKEVESLLAQQSAAEDFIESPALDAAARGLAGDLVHEHEMDYVGRSLLHYRIEEKVGEGGMGVVYRAFDTRLDRQVALKLLAPHIAGDRNFRERFDREAKVISRLDHPNICALHDVGEHEGVHFLIMQYLDGKTLAERLKRGPLPLVRALRHAIEIAEALDMAHRHGIVHRDLKPGNIMLTKMGAKLLDFGLAKTTPVVPTADAPITEEGTVLGTFQYMAPEQLKGMEADARTDIFAFGAVLYEMLTGKRAFEGTSQSSVITAIMSSEPPPVSSRLPMTPPALERLVKHCLAKDPDDRKQSLHDVALELQWLVDAGPVAAPARSNRRLVWGGCMLAALAVAGLVLTLIWQGSRQAVPQPAAVHTLLLPPAGYAFGDQVAVSPDGSKLAAVVFDASGARKLWVRSLSSLTEKFLPDTDGAVTPFWSVDSKSIGFFARGKLKTISALEGPSRPLSNARSPAGGTWNAEGTILFCPDYLSVLNRISAEGEPSRAVTRMGQEDRWGHVWPQFLADGRHFLFQSRSSTDRRQSVYLGLLDSPDAQLLLSDALVPNFAPPDYLLFVRAGSLMAQRFDFAHARPLAEPVPVAGPVYLDPDRVERYGAIFSVSGNGVLVYSAGAPAGTRRLVWRGHDGDPLGSPIEPGNYIQVYLSPFETQASVIQVRDGEENLWLWPFDTNILSQLTFGTERVLDPIWSPDARKLAYQIYLQNKTRIMMLTLGERSPKVLLDDGLANFPDDWSADGKWILGRRLVGEKFFVIRLAADGSAPPQPLLETMHANLDQFQLSPDDGSQWVAYNSDEGGRWEVYVARYPSMTDARRVSSTGGCQPIWRRDGKELFYLTQDAKVMSVPMVKGATLQAAAPRMLFQSSVPVNCVMTQYAVAANGQKFLLVEREQAGDPLEAREPLHLVTNWPTLLRR